MVVYSSFFIVTTVKAAAVGPVKSNTARNMLLQFHAEYTSITDELESVCHMLVSPTSTISVDKPRTELSKREFAAMIEKQHLKECEDNDYEIMKRLLVARESLEETDDSFEAHSLDVTARKVLKRETALDIPVTPSKSLGGFVEETEIIVGRFNRNLSADRAYSKQSPSNLLNPVANTQSMDQKLLRKSMDSLTKNSSSETEYSLHPYKVIKQSSNDTNTSMTGSFNVENQSIANDTSLDQGDSSLNQTVIENPLEHPRTNPLKMGAAFLRKQFSTEKSQRIDPESLQFAKNQPPIAEDTDHDDHRTSSGNKPSNMLVLQAKKQQLQTDSSSSTEECREERLIPAINTEAIQDEIAKLSSNIKSSTDEEKDPPINETMC